MARSNQILVTNAKEKLNQLKNEVASDLNVNLSEGDNGNNTARENGSVGGEMVKRMIAYSENNFNQS